jgi:hypothetical protein
MLGLGLAESVGLGDEDCAPTNPTVAKNDATATETATSPTLPIRSPPFKTLMVYCKFLT